jgi:hypothetical protein
LFFVFCVSFFVFRFWFFVFRFLFFVFLGIFIFFLYIFLLVSFRWFTLVLFMVTPCYSKLPTVYQELLLSLEEEKEQELTLPMRNDLVVELIGLPGISFKQYIFEILITSNKVMFFFYFIFLFIKV